MASGKSSVAEIILLQVKKIVFIYFLFISGCLSGDMYDLYLNIIICFIFGVICYIFL